MATPPAKGPKQNRHSDDPTSSPEPSPVRPPGQPTPKGKGGGVPVDEGELPEGQ